MSSLSVAGAATAAVEFSPVVVGVDVVPGCDARYDVNMRFQWSHDLSAPLVLGRVENRSGRRHLLMLVMLFSFGK